MAFASAMKEKPKELERRKKKNGKISSSGLRSKINDVRKI
jgi:hypothetical protein